MKIEDKIKIGIDIDEIVVAFMQNYLTFHNKKHNTNFLIENITNYHLWKSGFHNSKEESIKEVSEFQESDLFNPRLILGAKKGIEEISQKHKITFITSRPESLKEKTMAFFYKHFPNNGYEFVFSGEIYGGKSKSYICNEKNINIMIEDDPDYALNCAKNGIKSFLLEKPWNKSCETHENLIKVKDWAELINLLK